MKQNLGITIITLVITILVIIILASITIYTGMDTVDSVRIKQAKDATNAIYLSLIANENSIPSGSGDGKMISDYQNIAERTLTNEDFEIMGLDYTTENCIVKFAKFPSGENFVVYNFTYTDELNNTYDNLVYTSYKEITKTNLKPEFDETKKVNRPVLSDEGMVPLNYSGERVANVYTENWYSYDKSFSKLATMEYDSKTFVWIPRFAYKIQDFYFGKSYQNVPATAVDIIFLRETTNNISNDEVLPVGYTVHPAFENGASGFWVMTDIMGEENSISNATSSANILGGHLMKNSEYAAAVFLSRYLNNSQITFDDKEFVAAVCNQNVENFDVYSTDNTEVNYIENIRGHALLDTPWNLQEGPTLPNSTNTFLLRDVNLGGPFYYESTDGITVAAYRVVITK